MIEFREVTGGEAHLLAALAKLHCACLPGSAITRLGSDYATHFYRMLAGSPSDHVLVALDSGVVKGGLVLSERPGSLTRRMIIHTPLVRYLLARFRLVALPMLTGPGVASAPSSGSPSPGTEERPIRAQDLRRLETLPELVHLFVAQAYRGQDVGLGLVECCTELCRGKGFASYFVKTAAEDGNRAARFYERLGFTKLGIMSKQGRRFTGFTIETR